MSVNHKAQAKFEEGMADFANQNYDRSISLFSDAIAADPTFQLAFKSRGAAFLKLGKTREAIADFNRIIEMDSDNARAYHLRGLAYEKAGDYENALRDFNSSIEQNPEYGAAYFSRASLYTRLGETDQAAADLKMVTHLSEVNIETFANQNNVWRSRHLHLESMHDDDLAMER